MGLRSSASFFALFCWLVLRLVVVELLFLSSLLEDDLEVVVADEDEELRLVVVAEVLLCDPQLAPRLLVVPAFLSSLDEDEDVVEDDLDDVVEDDLDDVVDDDVVVPWLRDVVCADNAVTLSAIASESEKSLYVFMIFVGISSSKYTKILKFVRQNKFPVMKIRSAFLIALCIMPAMGCKQVTSTHKGREYNVMILQPTSRKLSSSYSATIRGKQDIDIRPKVGGYITEIDVREGSIVHKGQTLFVIDQVAYEAELQTAIANVDVANAAVAAAELTLNSKEQLYKESIISAYDLQMARTTLAKEKAQLAQAKANETNARNNLNYTSVKSPVDGVVGSLPFRVGALVSPSDATPLTTVSDNSDMYVYFSMTESQVLSLSRQFGSLDNVLKNMPDLELQLSDGTIYSEKGRIEAISGIIDPTTGAVAVRAKFPNRSRLLLSGGSGNVILPHQQSDCIVIPQSATYEVQDKVYAYKYENGVAKSHIISVFEISNGKEYVVQSGLAAGDTLVVEGVGLLKDGTELSIKKIVEGGR